MPPARLLAASVATAALATGCGGGEDPQPPAPGAEQPAPSADDLPRMAGAERGRRLVLQTGCLACHEIGAMGKAGVGPRLDRVGEALPATAIRRALVEPTPPMPSYRDVPRDDLRALVRYLEGLRGR